MIDIYNTLIADLKHIRDFNIGENDIVKISEIVNELLDEIASDIELEKKEDIK